MGLDNFPAEERVDSSKKTKVSSISNNESGAEKNSHS